MKSVLRDWVMELPLRHQGVLVAAIRGCDGAPKENSAKPLVRALRYAVLNPADEREVGMPSAFMAPGFSDEELRGFLRDWDHYSVHFVQHLMHACEVVGYRGPGAKIAVPFRKAYWRIVEKLHLHPETPDEMNDRLTEDRIAEYGNATEEGNPIPASSVYSTEHFLMPEPDPDASVQVIITSGRPSGVVKWETGPSYLGNHVVYNGFATPQDALDDAVDHFHPAPVRPIFQGEIAP